MGEVLVSRVVTDLVAGAGLQFAERGSHELKGLPGRWDLFAADPFPPPLHSHCRSTKLCNEPCQVCLCSWASFAQALAKALRFRTMRAGIR